MERSLFFKYSYKIRCKNHGTKGYIIIYFYYNKIDFENIDIDRYKHIVDSKETLLILDIYYQNI